MDKPSPCGVLIVDKPEGPTSHDVVGRIRRVLGTRRVGHAGTLDPMASGVLVVLVGEATKLEPYLSANDKSYLAEIAFGTSTDTLDRLGETLEQRPIPDELVRDLEKLALAPADDSTRQDEVSREIARVEALGASLIAEAMRVELSRTEQVPPRFSAIKVDGQKGYDRARRGESFELDARHVRLLNARIAGASVSNTMLRVEMLVSKGYYVRSFARDLGVSLGVPAHLTGLRRTRSGCFDLGRAVSLDADREAMTSSLVSLDAAAQIALTCSKLTSLGVAAARRGQALGRDHFVDEPDDGAWLDEENHLVAIGRLDADGVGRVQRGFVNDEPSS